jgi:hypothetical protein
MFSSMLQHLSSSSSCQNSLPTAEPVSAENVVYAIVQDEEEKEDDLLLQVNWELVLVVSFMILVVGIAIGRFTASTTSQSRQLLFNSCEIPNMTTCAGIYKEHFST